MLIAMLALCGCAAVETKAETTQACADRVNKAALRAMGQTGPLSQMQLTSLPFAFSPDLTRVEVRVGGQIYAVDVMVDKACNVVGATTRLDTNGPP